VQTVSGLLRCDRIHAKKNVTLKVNQNQVNHPFKPFTKINDTIFVYDSVSQLRHNLTLSTLLSITVNTVLFTLGYIINALIQQNQFNNLQL
jgi:hypothetical protein